MRLDLKSKLGDGMFADVWMAVDELDREVAVKIIRPASIYVADALAHAKALARATHNNVVSVLTIEKVHDPETQSLSDCVVMELIRGETLTTLLSKGKISVEHARSIGAGIIDGLAHIHAQGMSHGDLHSDNVMIIGGHAKIIDILYISSLASVSTIKREERVRKDLLAIRILLQEIIVRSEADSGEATEFNNMLASAPSIEDMRAAFSSVLSEESSGNLTRQVSHAFSRFVDQNFVAGDPYAFALAEETPDNVAYPLLMMIVDERVFEEKHRSYVRAIWTKLSPEQRRTFLASLGAAIERDTPGGKWPPSLRLLSALGRDGWTGLSPLVQIKLESMVVKDVLAGRVDIYSVHAASGGSLGTYANTFYPYFRDKGVLAQNLISLLWQGWFTQNYVATYFFYAIPNLAEATGTREKFIEVIRYAVRNDARVVSNNLSRLPEDWVAEIQQ